MVFSELGLMRLGEAKGVAQAEEGFAAIGVEEGLSFTE